MASYDDSLLERLCDEMWWLDAGKLAAKGDPRQVLASYRSFITDRLAAWGSTLSEPLDCAPAAATVVRRYSRSKPWVRMDSLHWCCAAINPPPCGSPSVTLATVEKPVTGIMIRSRVGMDVYGTNTELERIDDRSGHAGDEIRVRFDFRCELCPGD